GFFGDQEGADVARRADVRAAAELGAEGAIADRDHGNLVAVLLAEELHRAGRDRVLRVLDGRVHRLVLENRFVDDPLDLLSLPRSDGGEVDEVESQPIGSHDEAPRLTM